MTATYDPRPDWHRDDTRRPLWSDAELVQIILDAVAIEDHLADVARREEELGHPVPLRSSLGYWELMRLDQLALIRADDVFI